MLCAWVVWISDSVYLDMIDIKGVEGSQKLSAKCLCKEECGMSDVE